MLTLPVSLDAAKRDLRDRSEAIGIGKLWRRTLGGFLRPKRRVPVLEESLFQADLRKEQRRLERSGRSFLVLRIAGPGLFAAECNGRIRKRAVRVLSLAARQTDTVGWLEAGRVMGIICTELGTHDERRAGQAILAKMERVVRAHLAPAERSCLGLTVEVFARSALREPAAKRACG